jgi:hypothetical protein
MGQRRLTNLTQVAAFRVERFAARIRAVDHNRDGPQATVKVIIMTGTSSLTAALAFVQ